ncbi:hypothetical protein MRB53_021868 [Persea americana]|uniref:Uncharacterized protein n=1 Tax=Persea americana TaxID=3435 RepID=A0ACC2L546_PERAE|nr:hypothetical protein MRB53_021868 [Persea americana]|eukprot:TRINITY_DN2650_c0_g1_i1.p1 TRINITY_DN2650_c0_g1~~TRINITY_DN2650_c0_g1_i1.p1  ORF type:complete len:286 (-),score=60.35 TRINITY_DN2650_c0_g1_i1:164-1021(-)
MMMMCSSSPSRSLVANVLVSSSDSSSSSRGHVSYRACRFCPCSRRHFLVSSVLPTLPANACDPMAVLNNVHPPRPDWYEEFYASVIDQGMKAYEAEIAGYKTELFTHLRESKRVLELGVGTGPNFKYYAGASGISVFAVDPNKQMEKYARRAAVAAGLPSTHFSFIRAVGEALPMRDASMDAVIGTLVLCSVKDVDMTLQEVKRVLKPGGQYIFIEHVAANDGTPLKLLQQAVDPLQQLLFDGCHLCRETGKIISEAGFLDANVNMAFVSSVSLISPHVYGVAFK